MRRHGAGLVCMIYTCWIAFHVLSVFGSLQLDFPLQNCNYLKLLILLHMSSSHSVSPYPVSSSRFTPDKDEIASDSDEQLSEEFVRKVTASLARINFFC